MQYSTHVKSYEQKCVQPYMFRHSLLRIKSNQILALWLRSPISGVFAVHDLILTELQMIPNRCVACFGSFGEKPVNWRPYLSGNSVPVKQQNTASLKIQGILECILQMFSNDFHFFFSMLHKFRTLKENQRIFHEIFQILERKK